MKLSDSIDVGWPVWEQREGPTPYDWELWRREYAGRAMQGMLSCSETIDMSTESLCEAAESYADTLIARMKEATNE